MGGENADWICSLWVGTALVDELVYDALSANV